MKILLASLGFDEKFQIRAVMRNYKELEKVVIVGKLDDERSKKAFDSLVNFLKTAEIDYEYLEVDPRDFKSAVAKIISFISKYKTKEFIVNLSGGMRALIVEILIAFTLSGKNARVEIETEDLLSIISFEIDYLRPLSLSIDHVNILLAIQMGYNTITAIHKYVGIPLSTTWRRVKELQKEGLVTEDLKLTEKGELVVKIASS
ncbi:MAG: CRISPR-associated CARF protein Csa3 [Sulfolobaceae archaeon]